MNKFIDTLYYIAIKAYDGLIAIASIFNKKAALLRTGRKNTLKQIAEYKRQNNGKSIWIHAASLGEFEQGRPIIEAIKERWPERKIVLSFYSPSGYEVRKNYGVADLVCYMLSDTPSNARRFLDAIQPEIVYLIKYEFWHFHITEVHKRCIPLYGVSMIFRPEQPFFASWGGWYADLLHCFNHLYVQDETSAELLNKINISAHTVAGDSRFDRVAQIAAAAQPNDIAEKFVSDAQFVVVCGSTWPPDEEVLIDYIQHSAKEMKFIIAPHETHESRIESLISKLPADSVRYTKAPSTDQLHNARCLVIDTIGLLSSLYKYADFAYVGGGFGVGIHNTLEPATFGIPIAFGPNYKKFKEAHDLIHVGAAFAIRSKEDFRSVADKIYADKEFREAAGAEAATYCKKMCGATKLIVEQTL